MHEPQIGATVDAGSAREPGPVALTGRFGRVEKLDAARHAADLWTAFSGHDRIWTYLAYGPFADAGAFARWLTERASLPDPFSYAVIDRDGGALGIVTLMAVRPSMRVIEVGNILLSPRLQRTPLATEAQYLLARYAFEDLGYRRYEWKCDALNAASRRAALRFGFTFEGIFGSIWSSKGATAIPPGMRCSIASGRRANRPSSAGSRRVISMPMAGSGPGLANCAEISC
jgi:RimJ/RimL family protein N-acetyltransferase